MNHDPNAILGVDEVITINCGPSPFTDAVFGGDGHLITAGKDGAIRIWDSKNGSPRNQTLAHSQRIQCIAFSANPALLFSCSNGEIKEWNMKDMRLRRVIMTGDINSAVQVDPDARYMATVTEKAEVKIWHLAADPPRLLSTIPTEFSSSSVCVSSDGRLFAFGVGPGKSAITWDVKKGHQVRKISDKDVMGLAFVEPNRHLAIGSWNHVNIWDEESGELLKTLSFPKDALILATTPSGNLLAATGNAGNVFVWDTMSWQLKANIPVLDATVFRLSFSSDGTALALLRHDIGWNDQSGYSEVKICHFSK
jgi:WD40 repeat protein